MSSVVISGDTSGSITLQAPAVAGTTTLTLPATTGTVFTTTGGTLTGGLTVGGILNTGSTGQVQFPATQNPSSDANTLDDYEEGTWTATDASGAGLTLTNTTQRYTKIGRLVTLSIENLAWPSTANANAVEIGGLPFSCVYVGGGGGISNYTGYTVGLVVLTGVTSFRLYNLPGPYSRTTNANMSGSSLYFSVVYTAST
jgi:hypothetical protein